MKHMFADDFTLDRLLYFYYQYDSVKLPLMNIVVVSKTFYTYVSPTYLDRTKDFLL